MARRKLSPREIVERLQMIEDLAAEGRPIGEAIRSAGVLPVDYEGWIAEYDGLRRTLGPLLRASRMPPRKWRRAK
jgi:putative transposase